MNNAHATHRCLRCSRPLVRGEIPDCDLCNQIVKHPEIVEARAASPSAHQTYEVEALDRLLSTFETLVKDAVVTGEKAAQVIADMDTLKRFMAVTAMLQRDARDGEEAGSPLENPNSVREMQPCK